MMLASLEATLDQLHDIYRIERALQTRELNPQVFERFAQDVLSDKWEHFIPTSGGTDHGRDADIFLPGRSTPMRLLVTSSRTLDGVRKNMLGGIASMRKHRVDVDDVGIFTAAKLSETSIAALRRSAAKRDVSLNSAAIFEQRSVASFLRRYGQWRSQLLGLSGYPPTLAPLPASIAERPWVTLDLVGREDELDELISTKGDVIVTGYAGVGKSRLAAEIPDGVFLENEANLSRLADDLKSANPSIVIVDDAGRSTDLIRYLVQLRRTEPDLNGYRIIAVTWPHETELVQDHLRNAAVFTIGLLEPHHIDTLTEQAGVAGTLARDEIVRQAEGRPGWALALTDVLFTAGDGTSVLNGNAIRGQIKGFLRRSQSPGTDATSDLTLLTLIAALGSVAESDLDRVTEVTGISQIQVRRHLRRLSTSGLVEARIAPMLDRTRYITYEVRPPMLARALVAEQVFDEEVPIFSLGQVVTTWPEKKTTIAEAVIDAALLGSDHAAAEASTVYRDIVADPDVSINSKLHVAHRYGLISSMAGNEVATELHDSINSFGDALNQHTSLIDAFSSALGDIAARFVDSDAIRGLLTLATFDSRPPNQVPDGPYRTLENLVHHFHPELPLPATRNAVLQTLIDWVADAEPTDGRWRVVAAQIENLMNPEYEAAYSRLATPNTLQMYAAIAPPSVLGTIIQDVWPPLLELLRTSPHEVQASGIDVVLSWVRLSKGYGGKFGSTPPRASVEVADKATRRLLEDIATVIGENPGLIARLVNNLGWLETETTLTVPVKHEPFVRDINRTESDTATRELADDIAAITDQWPIEDRDLVLANLNDARVNIKLAGVTWPSRITLALEALACRITDPIPWIEGALDQDLFPDAAVLLDESASIPAALWKRCFETPRARWAAIQTALTQESQPLICDLAVDSVQPSDFDLLYRMAVRNDLPAQTWEKLLTKPEPATRAAMAAAMVGSAHRTEDWEPGALSDLWESAIVLLDPATTDRLDDWRLEQLIDILASRYPGAFEVLTSSLLKRSSTEETFAFPHGLWNHLHKLPPAAKTEIWRTHRDTTVSHYLRQHLVGADIDWLESMMDNGEFTVDEALASYTGLGPHPTMEQLAKLLIPRGADPDHIAVLASLGMHMGEESEWCTQLIGQFADWAEDDDESIAALRQAGVTQYTERRSNALANERDRRLRGEL